MKTRGFFAILPKSLCDEFFGMLSELESLHTVQRNCCLQTKGNKYGMTGDTYNIAYEQGGKWSTFQKDLRILWDTFNSKYPKTQWKGK